MAKGLLVVISGPSGVGKGTIISEVLANRANTSLSVSCTTRSPRPGEEDGVHYWFIEKSKFEQLIEEDEFLEYMPVFDNYYGTPRKKVEELRERGIDVLLDIDVKGADAVKEKAPDAIRIFILPPSLEELKHRLIGRGTETAEQIERRTARAESEIAKSGEYDHRIINNDLAEAVRELTDILDKEHLKK